MRFFVYENTYVRKINGLYLNSRTSDVNFVFDVDTDHPEKVPAHKAILSLDNPVFDAMFYGSIKEEGDIPIADACAAAFKEFLQFFYLDQVRLSAENIAQVMNLCKKYEMDECMKACETTLQKLLTINDMCFGYSIALFLEQKNLVEFCEWKIKANARGIMESESFLEAGRSLLEKILTVVSSGWSALETVMACMEWAKAECGRNNLETSPENLRSQLKELFERIPFEKLTLEQFTKHFITYKGFFSAEEILDMNQKILLRNEQSTSFDLQLLPVNLNPRSSLFPNRILNCDRRVDGATKIRMCSASITTFSSNKTMLLSKLYIPVETGTRTNCRVFKSTNNIAEYSIASTGSRIVFLPEPYLIEAGQEYSIFIDFDSDIKLEIPLLKQIVRIEQDVEIKFTGVQLDFVTRLIFEITAD